jgi:hypothetical protein
MVPEKIAHDIVEDARMTYQWRQLVDDWYQHLDPEIPPKT